jgi:hypothetical protein
MSADLTRRQVLVLTAAAAVTAVAPIEIAPAAPPPVPAWAVGTPGEWNWQVIEAATEHDARLAWLSEEGVPEECAHGGPVPRSNCDCDVCEEYAQLDTTRKSQWDGKNIVAGGVEWFAAGYGANCDRCHSETTPEDGKIVDREIVCGDCLAPENQPA